MMIILSHNRFLMCSDQTDCQGDRKDQTIHEQLKMQDEINRLQMVIQKTEKAAWKEQQPKKRFELYTKLQEYKKQLEEITHGQA